MSPIGADILHELEAQNEIQQFQANITAKRHVAYITPAAAEVEASKRVTAEPLGKDETGERVVCGQKVLQAPEDSAVLVAFPISVASLSLCPGH